jgi:acetylornithine deacetylase
MEGARLIGWVNDRNAALQGAQPSSLAARFDPPFTTLHVGMISGGTAHNITAANCRFAVEMRVVPGEDLEVLAAEFEAAAQSLAKRMKKVHPGAGMDLQRFFRVPALQPEPQGEAEALVRRLTGANAGGAVSYGTEAGIFQAAGYSAVVCGPGDIAQAHQPDEYLDLSQFESGQAFMTRLLEDLA